MPSPKEHDVTIDLMIQAAEKLTGFTAGYTFDTFLGDEKTQSAVIMQLIVIGELAKKLPKEVVSSIDLPWRLMAGFRDFAVHEYFKLELKQVWDTVVNDVPVVREKLSAYLKTLGNA